MAFNFPQFGARSPYLNPFLEDEEDEYQKAMLRALRGEGASPEDLAYYAQTAPQRYEQRMAAGQIEDLGPEEKAIAARMAMARDLMATPDTTLQTAGRVSAANPWRGLATGLQRGVGAYMSTKAGKDLEALGERETASKQAALRQALARQEEEAIQKRLETMQAADLQRELKGMDITAADRREAASQAAQNARNIASGADLKPYLIPGVEDPQLLQVNPRAGQGERMRFADGTELTPEQMRGATPWDPGQQGTPSALDVLGARHAEAARLSALETEEGVQRASAEIAEKVRPLEDILLNTDVDDYTGLLNPKRFFAKYDIGEDAWRGQYVDQQLRYVATAAIGELANIFKPMSDTDVKTLLEGLPQSTDDPRTITNWMGRQGRAELRKQYTKARVKAETDAQKASLDKLWTETENKLNNAIMTAAFRQKIPTSQARQLGLDEEELTYFYATMNRGR